MSSPLTAEEFAQKVSEQIQSLPTLPDTALKLRAILADPDCDFDDILSNLVADPGLCGDLIRLANSPFYGQCGRVQTIRDAVLALGMVNLSNFILVAYSNKIVRSRFSRLKNLAGYFSHSSKVSGAAYFIARASGASQKDQEVCKLAGLLHNIGRLVIAVASEQWMCPLDNVSAEATGKKNPEFFWLDACEVGMRVCQKWNFPETLAEGIGRHHSPIKGDDVNYVALIIYLAEFLIIENLSLQVILSDFSPELLSRMNLTVAVLAKAREDYRGSMQKPGAGLNW
jgi:HD-like signal output (HDOD) protein